MKEKTRQNETEKLENRKPEKMLNAKKNEAFAFPKASIVVATYKNPTVLKKALNGMLSLDYPNDFEIIVVDDGSNDGTVEMLKKDFGKEKRIRFFWFEKNMGVCKARNKGILEAKYPIVVNMDHDCIPEKDWLKKIVAGFSDSKIGVVSSFGYYGGTSTAFRKELLDKVEGYDEAYRYYREDTDLSFKIMDLGYEFKVVKADYEHDHKVTAPKGIFGLLKHTHKRLKYHMNDVLLFKKHPKLAGKFLNVRFGFLVDPRADFGIVAGTWRNPFDRESKSKTKWLELSSPQGITFIQNKSPLHALAIILVGIGFVFAIKVYRLAGSIKHGKLLF